MKITLSRLKNIIREAVEEELGTGSRYEREEFTSHPLIAAVIAARDPKELSAAKRQYNKASDSGAPVPSPGAFFYWYDQRKEELKNIKFDEKRLSDPSKAAAEHRMDTLLRTRDSSGRATPRKF